MLRTLFAQRTLFDRLAFSSEVRERATDLLLKTVILEAMCSPPRSRFPHVRVPFGLFQLVRGPRLVPGGPPLDVSGGIFQIGMTLSKFKMAANTTELEDFRAGRFKLRIRRIGFYDAVPGGGDAPARARPGVPDTLSKEEAERAAGPSS